MALHDIVAQENDSWDHFNTGWMWIRSMPETVAAWQGVLDRDMVKTSRDQNNFNEVRPAFALLASWARRLILARESRSSERLSFDCGLIASNDRFGTSL